jgi:hypothetical protein
VLWVLEVRGKEMEGRDGTGKKERKSFLYCRIEESEKVKTRSLKTEGCCTPLDSRR